MTPDDSQPDDDAPPADQDVSPEDDAPEPGSVVAEPDDAPTDETAASTDDEASDEASEATRLRRYLNRAVLAGLFLLGAIAAVRFYLAASNAIGYWVAGPYQSAFQAAFNLVVLLLVGAGITRQLARIRD